MVGYQAQHVNAVPHLGWKIQETLLGRLSWLCIHRRLKVGVVAAKVLKLCLKFS